MGLIEEHVSYARGIAGEMLKKLPSSVDRADVESAACLGLVQAANAWDPSRGVSFTTFAYYRIRGAIYDSLRQTARLNRFDVAANDYMTDRTAVHEPASTVANVYTDVKNTAATLLAAYVLSLESLSQDPVERSELSPCDSALANERSAVVRRELQRLPPKNRAVMEAYYFEELSLEEVGKKLGLSKSWVCRVHAKSLDMLREGLVDFSPVRAEGASLHARSSARHDETRHALSSITA